MPKKMAPTTITIEYEGLVYDQFSENEKRNNDYWPSVFLQGLIGRVAQHFEDLSKKVTEVSITESGYKVTMRVDRSDSDG